MFTSAISPDPRILALLALTVSGSGCARSGAPVASAYPCLSEDSIGSGRDTLVFSDANLSPETLDASGTEVSLWRRDGRWLGALRKAEGELGNPRPLRSVTLDIASGKIALSDSAPQGRLTPFAGTLTCSRIEGTWTLFGGTTAARVVLARVPHSGFQVRPPAAEATGEAQAFWSEFRRAALAGDYAKIERWTRFPLQVHGAGGFDNRPREGFADFFSGVMQHAVVPRAAQPGTMRTLLERTEQLSPEQSSPDGDAFRVGSLQFDLIDGRWQLTSIDLASD
jgi:hypothetical protein